MDSEILTKLARYCAYQERCISEIKQKIQELDSEADHSIYIQWLQENNYLNENRFIGLFIRSKFNQKKWGRGKIQFELRKKGISDSDIQAHWDEIAEADYSEALKVLLEKKHLRSNQELRTRNTKSVTGQVCPKASSPVSFHTF